MTIGPLTMGAGFLLMLTVTDPLQFWLQMMPGILLFGLGLSITVAPLTSAILGAVSTAQSGIGSAVNNAVSRVAGLVAIACAGTIIGGTLDTDAFHRVVLVTAVLFIAGGLVSFAGIRTPKAAPDAAAMPPPRCGWRTGWPSDPGSAARRQRLRRCRRLATRLRPSTPASCAGARRRLPE